MNTASMSPRIGSLRAMKRQRAGDLQMRTVSTTPIPHHIADETNLNCNEGSLFTEIWTGTEGARTRAVKLELELEL